MTAAIKAGFAYFAAVFAIGFALGTARALVVAPRLGELNAMLIEVPIMLAASWWICGRVLAWIPVSMALGHRLCMSATAFWTLLFAEGALSLLVFGRTGDEFLASYGSISSAIGLAAQVAFALFPLAKRNSLPAS